MDYTKTNNRQENDCAHPMRALHLHIEYSEISCYKCTILVHVILMNIHSQDAVVQQKLKTKLVHQLIGPWKIAE